MTTPSNPHRVPWYLHLGVLLAVLCFICLLLIESRTAHSQMLDEPYLLQAHKEGDETIRVKDRFGRTHVVDRAWFDQSNFGKNTTMRNSNGIVTSTTWEEE